jgi:hypothetical protein
MIIDRRGLIGSGVLLALGSATRAAAAVQVLTPEHFGAKGDGVTNDTAAFQELSRAVAIRGGGEIALRKTTYLVGRQRQAFRGGAPYAFEPASLLEFVGLRSPLLVRGNGARLRCAPGLRYGTFDPVTGAKTRHDLPYLGPGELATPYRWMVRVEDCAAAVEIRDLELDGNLPNLQIGGGYGDTGWQIPAVGLFLKNNRGLEKVVRLYSHHHGQDGIQIDGLDADRGSAAASILEDVRTEDNGRQGVSMVGGRGYSFARSKFNRTGRAGLGSNPGSGVDIEAEAGKKIRAVRFTDCEFSDNFGPAMVADSGDSEDISFTRCSFVGATNWAAWPNKPRMRFIQCSFVGPIVRAFGDKQPERATQFHDCVFRDDPKLSPTGKVYGGENRDRPIGDLPNNENVLFNRCKFLLTHQAALPWSVNVIYSDCVLSQKAPQHSFPRGTFVGRNIISGAAILADSRNRGIIVINGRTTDQPKM